MKISIKKIKVTERKRQLDKDKAIALAESIKLIGLLNPITVSEDYTLISGRHRLEAHKILGLDEIEVRIFKLSDVSQKLAEIDENIIRNELNDIDMGEHLIERDNLLETLGMRAKRGDNRFTLKNRPEMVSSLKTNKEIGRKIGISERLIRMKKQIARGITSENKDRLRNTRFATNTTGLLEISRLDPTTQNLVVDRLINGRHENVVRLIYRVKREIRRERAIENLKVLKNRRHECIRLIHGDFKKVGNQIEEESINLLYTDPPYMDKDSIHLYEEVARLGERVLKDGGSCLVYAYQTFLPDVIAVMSKHLKYWWVISINYSGKHNRNHRRGIFVKWKPLLFFVKGDTKTKTDLVSDSIQGNYPDKTYHRWTQDTTESDYFVHHLTPIDGIVLDCMMGTGTTGLSAVKFGRKFIGIEIDKERFEIGSKRILKTLQSMPNSVPSTNLASVI